MKVCFCVGVCVLFMSAFVSPCETHVKSFFHWKEKKNVDEESEHERR